MSTLILQRNNKTYISLGGKAVVISPHTVEQFETSKGKLKKIQRRMVGAISNHFRHQLVEVLAIEES